MGPYCTGDVHAGEDAKKFAGAFRNFNGAPNLKLMMAYATQQFPEVETLFITGESAGGFGAAASYATIRDFYPQARGVLMDDSGPILDDEALPVCLQTLWRNTWNLNKNIPDECPCHTDSGNLVTIWSYGKQRYPNDSFSLISSQTDAVISTFFAYSNNNCHAIVPVGFTKLQAGLQRLAKTSPVYIIPGNAHTHTPAQESSTAEVSMVWLRTSGLSNSLTPTSQILTPWSQLPRTLQLRRRSIRTQQFQLQLVCDQTSLWCFPFRRSFAEVQVAN